MNFIRSLLNGWMPPTTEQDLAQAKSTVEGLISSAPIAIFSKSYCPHCVNAKSLLASLGQKRNTKSIELDHENNGVAIQRYLAERNTVSKVTVPQASQHIRDIPLPFDRFLISFRSSLLQIYIKGQLIGGCSDLQSLHSRGKLEPLLNAL